MNIAAFKRSPLRLVEGRGDGRFKDLSQGEFDWVMGHHGFDKQGRSGGSDHDKYTHRKTGRVVSVKPRRSFFHDILERISKNVAKESGDKHLRHHANWDPAFLKQGGRALLPTAMDPEKEKVVKAKTGEAEQHSKMGEKYRSLANTSGGANLPAGISQIRGLRIAATAFKKARKANASAKLLTPKD